MSPPARRSLANGARSATVGTRAAPSARRSSRSGHPAPPTSACFARSVRVFRAARCRRRMAPDDELRAIVAFLKTLPRCSRERRPAAAAALHHRRRASRSSCATAAKSPARAAAKTHFPYRSKTRRAASRDSRRAPSRKSSREAGPAPRAREAHPAVTARDILDGLADPSRWLTFSGDYSGRRHSPLTQITPANVHRLTAQWTFQSGTMTRGRGFESTRARARRRVVRDRLEQLRLGARRTDRPAVLAVPARAAARSHLRRAGARQSRLRASSAIGCSWSRSTRTSLAFDRRTRQHPVGHGPRRLQDRLLGDDGAARASSATKSSSASRAASIRHADFSTHTTRRPARASGVSTRCPAPGEPGSETWPASSEVLARGGGGTWMTGSYDPELNLLYWGTGNPNPDYWGHGRLGDNLYTNSLVAIDADTGRLKWHYQFTPHDTHDWDSNHVPVLGDGQDWRRRSQSGHGREPQRLLLRRSIARPVSAARREAVHRHDVGARDRARRPSDRPQRWQQGLPARPVGRDELQSAVVRSVAATVPRHGARDLRDLRATGAEGRSWPGVDGRRRARRPRAAQLRRAARHRRGHRRTPLGVPLCLARDVGRPLDGVRVSSSPATTRATSWPSRRARAGTCGGTRRATVSGARRR